MVRKTIFMALAAALPASASAQAFKIQCLSRSEAEGLMTYALPEVVRSLSRKCAAHLPATAPLVQAGTVMSARYQGEADQAWPVAKAAFDTLSGVKMTAMLGDSGSQKLINTTVSNGLSEKIQPSQCGGIDRILDALQPLPPKNMAVVTAALLEISGKADSPVRICQISGAPSVVTTK